MRTTRLYIPDDLDAAAINSSNHSTIKLNADDSRYLNKVMRFREGDKVELFNGDGNNYTASIFSTGKSTELRIESAAPNPTESNVSITLVQSLAKGTKLDLVIQKATELGVSRIAPVSTERTVLKVDEQRAQKKSRHWNKIAQSACAQCNRSIVPLIDSVTPLPQWLELHRGEFSVLIDPEGSSTLRNIQQVQSLNLLVGPEGGFSDTELQLTKDAGIVQVQCGPRVLRTETAGFAAIAILQSVVGDMG